LQIAYSEELHTYLKTTGLHASDLVKPKPKKNPRDRSGGPSTSQLNHPQQHLLGQTAGGGSSVPSASAPSTLTTAGQQLIQTLLGLPPGLATSAAGDATAALAQAWAGQPVQQVTLHSNSSNHTGGTALKIIVPLHLTTINGRMFTLSTARLGSQSRYSTTNFCKRI